MLAEKTTRLLRSHYAFAPALLLLCGCMAISYFIDSSASELHVDADSLDFGTVWATSEFPWRVRLTNPGHGEIKIVGIQTDCTCTTPRDENLRIAPGETKELVMNLDFSRVRAEKPFSAAEFRTSVILLCESDETWRQVCNISGFVRQSMNVPSPILDLGEWNEGDLPLSFTTEVACAEEVSQLAVQGQPVFANVAIEPIGDTLFRVVVTPLDSLIAAGRYNHTLKLSSMSDTGSELGSTAISLIGTALPRTYAIPASVRLGAVGVGTTQSYRIEVASRVGEDLTVVSAEVPDSDIVARLIGKTTVEIIMPIQLAGPGQAIVNLSVLKGCDGVEKILPIPIHWHAFSTVAAN